MSHDLVAELGGYRDELANAERRGRADRAAAVRGEIGRVSTAVEAQAVALEAQAESFKANGQDGPAGAMLDEAKALRLALGVPRTAAASEPVQKAVTPKKAGA